MNKKTILIISYSYLNSDPRVLRQINALRDSYQIETLGLSAVDDKTIPFSQIYTLPKSSILRKIKRFYQLISRKFDLYYWDDGKKNVRDKFTNHKIDLIIANDISSLPLALAIANNKVKVFFDAHEYHPLEFEDSLKWRLLEKPYMNYLCKTYISKVAFFSTVSGGIADKYTEVFNLKPTVINNAAYYKNLTPSSTHHNNIKLIHHGSAIKGRKIEQMIDMMIHLEDRFSLYLMLTGQNTRYYKKLVDKAKKNRNIFFIPPVPFEEIIYEINRYDIGLYILPPNNFNNYFALPNKIFEFIQARLCIVVSPNPEMGAVVEKYDLGVLAKNYTSNAMATAIKSLTIENITYYKNQSNACSNILSAEENGKKLNTIVLNLLTE